MNNYLIELSLIHMVLILGYWFFLRGERQFAKLRFFLLGSTVLALVIPLLKLPGLFSNQKSAVALPIGDISVETIAVTPQLETSYWYEDLIVWVYLFGCLFFLLKFIGSLIHLISLILRTKSEQVGSVNICKLEKGQGSFSFFNWVFINDETAVETGFDAILKHEIAHVTLGHTYDLIFIELFKIFFWWLPSTWYLQRELRKIHEYQADAYALKSYSIEQYSSVLIQSTLKSHGLALASSFHDGLILKRIKAMKENVKNVSPWKLGVLSILVALLFIVFACNEELDKDIKALGQETSSVSFDQLPQSMQKEVESVKDKLSFVKINIPKGKRNLSSLEIKEILIEMQGVDPDLLHLYQSIRSDDAIFVALKKSSDNFDYLAQKSKMEGDIFTIVEEQPEYEGGLEVFKSHIANNIKYPLQARKLGIEGRVYIQFIVEKDGSLSDILVVKGIGGGCDEEAVRVIKSLPSTFKPGSQRGMAVRVRMVMPIVFKLNSGKVNPDNSPQGIIVVEKVDAENGQLKVDASYSNGKWSGKVYSPEGDVLPGVNIVVVGSDSGTITDLEGNFSLVTDQSNELNLSFVGYKSVRLSSPK
tara:strand:+ start:5796 stop:7562 length:1767 start_codon:yes stop_codon:yes gene_type:complete